MLYPADYRRQAREALRGRWKALCLPLLFVEGLTICFGAQILYGLFFSTPRYIQLPEMPFSYVLNYPKGFGWALVVLFVIANMFYMLTKIGQYRAAKALLAGEKVRIRQMFPMSLLGKAVLMNVVRDLLVAAQMLLLIVPGIIALFRYQMADYLLAEDPELGVLEALRKSGERMRGHKMQLFSLEVSFIGWMLLLSLALRLVAQAVGSSDLGWAFYEVVSWALPVPLLAYRLIAETLFFRAMPAQQAWSQPSSAAWQPSEEAREDAGVAEAAASEASDADNAAAREMYLRHACSHSRMQAEGALEEYRALKPSAPCEARWREEYGRMLILRFDGDAAALDDLLRLIAEYAMQDLLTRTLARVDRHIFQQTIADEEILGMCGRALALVVSGVFDEDPKFIQRRREQVSEMVDRLEARLKQSAPDGEWQNEVRLLRGMCGEEQA